MYWAELLVAGLFVGAVYALYGLGITMVYKATRVPNFAHGAIGTVGAFVFYKTWKASQPRLQIKHLHFQIPFADSKAWWSHWDPTTPRLPLLLSLVLALAVSVVLGILIERLFMRYLVGAPTIGLIVATVGLFILITGLAIDFFNQQSETVPPIIREQRYTALGVHFFNSDVLVAVIALALALALGAFFRFTSLGIAIRATADSRETARLLGINANRVAQFSWAVGSALATLSAILIISRGNGSLDFTSLTLLILPGFAAAMFGGFISLVGTFVGGLTLGVAEALFVGIRWPDGFFREIFSSAGVPQFVSFMVVILVLMTRPKFIFKGVRVDEDSGVGFGRASSGLQPEDRLRRALDRRGALMLLLKDWTTGRFALAGMVAVAALAVPIFTVSYWSTVLGAAVFYALIALSIVVLTGWTGQISLAALAFAGAGAFGSALLSTQAHLPPFVVLPLCGLIGVPLAVLIGVPALRLRGFFLALATLAFMVACESWLFTQPGLTTRNDVDRMFLRVDLSQPSYYLSLGFALLVFLGVRNLGKTKVARAFHAIRDSENTAVSMGIDPVKYKLLAFALSGFIAGIAGGSFGYMNLKVVSGSFTFFFSLTFITFAVIAGLGLQAGAFLVPILFVIVPTLTARTTTGTNQSLFILSGYLAVRATIDYPNGVAAFWSRLLRPFSPSERVAWTTDEAAGAPAPEAALASAEADEP
ncbi:MAG: branched-chain amino acid transport system permease protein livM, partial [Acidimicrobiaceae bacterium]|nr:branched-chain amino acid transport system permease protein livM [Acidimicrobiaceae bacterium]